MKVTLLHGVYKIQEGHKELSTIIHNIKNGVYTTPVFKCRKAKVELSKKNYQKTKANLLPCFTPSGRFGQEWDYRDGLKIPIPPTKKGLLEYNGIVILDYDGLKDVFALEELEKKIKDCPYTHLCFISPSGEGLKVLVQTSNREPTQHPNVYETVSGYYQKLTGLESDKSSKNINRLCFVATDSNLLYNTDSLVFEFQAKLFQEQKQAKIEQKKAARKEQQKSRPVDFNSLDDITKAINRIEENGFNYVDGQRHEYVKRFSIECVKYGVTKSECTNFVESNLVSVDCDENKVLKVVQWAYDNIGEVGIYKEWSEKNGKNTGAKPSTKKEYVPELYQANEEEEQIISIPKLTASEIEELDSKIQKSMSYQSVIENTLNQFFDFRINTLKSREEYRHKGVGKFKEMEKMEYNSIARELLGKRGVKCTPAVLEGIILSDFSKKVHPLKENFEGWGQELGNDTTDYIAQVAKFVKTDAPKNLFLTVFKKWLVAAVANVFVEGHCTNHQCIILCGGQGTNKTTFFTSLFSAEYTFAGHIDLKNKDAMILLSDTFLVVLDEQFSVLNKESEWEALKSAVTMPRIKARRHYAKNSTLAPRIANFCGTANRIEILQDDTGNRRFIPFQLTEPVDINKLQKIDMRKVWAQAYQLFKNNWFYLPTAKEKNLIDKYQQGFKKLNTEHYLIIDMYEPFNPEIHQKEDLELFSSTEIWKQLEKDYNLNKEVTVSRIGRAMTFLNFGQKTVTREIDDKRGRFWHLKRL